jgi:aminoglycoside/choline kinase family phosphotransferase
MATLTEEALAWLESDGLLTSSEVVDLVSRSVPEGTALVHGSLDPSNVLVTRRGRATFLDLEAARGGPVSFDVASMAGGLLATHGRDVAGRWLAAAAQSVVAPSINVASHLALRAWNAHCAEALSEGARVDIAGLVKHLLGTRQALGRQGSPVRR